MNEEKIKKIAIIALLFSLIGLGIFINTSIPIISTSGNYTGDGTTNRSIPYDLGGRNASQITIISSAGSSPRMGNIIEPGYIYDIQNGSRLKVKPLNNSCFFISGTFNLNSSINNVTEFYNSTTNSAGWAGNALYTPFLASDTGNLINISINVSNANGNIMLAIYSDSTGSIGTLQTNSSSFAATNGHNNFSLINPVTKGVPYWIGIEMSSNTIAISRSTSYTGSYYNVYVFGGFPTNPTGLIGYAARFTTTTEITVGTSGRYYWSAS
jgi:hypothetical protein